MKYLRCERGLAMIETVIATTVIGILFSVAVPRFSRMLDEVCVDYEIRCLHSMLHYTQSVSRISQYTTFKFTTPTGYGMNTIECRVFTAASPQYYCVRKLNQSARIKEDHYLERDAHITNAFESGSFTFRANSEHTQGSDSLTISKGTFKRYLVMTDYGRIRISNQK